MPNELGLPEGVETSLCAATKNCGVHISCSDCGKLEVQGRFLTLTEFAEWEKAVEDAREEVASANALLAEAEIGAREVAREIADLTARAEKAEAALKEARKEAMEEVVTAIGAKACLLCHLGRPVYKAGSNYRHDGEGECGINYIRRWVDELAEKENKNART